jgi:hypothetical protein
LHINIWFLACCVYSSLIRRLWFYRLLRNRLLSGDFPANVKLLQVCKMIAPLLLTLSNPIFLPAAYSPALICFGRERGWWITCNYHTVLKRKTWRNRKSTACAVFWLKSVLHEEKRRTGSDSGQTNATKTVSDVFRHRSGTGKSYCWTRFDVGSERVNSQSATWLVWANSLFPFLKHMIFLCQC